MRLTSQDSTAPVHVRARTWLPAWPTAIVILLGLAGTFWLDRETGDAPVQHLYYLPIILAAVRFGRWGGLGGALAAIALYHLANEDLFSDRAIEADILQIVLFLLVGLVTAQLVSDANRLRLLSRTDDLTGLHNLRSFEFLLSEMVHAARVKKTTLSLLALDLDRLKSLNDRYGHLTGAEAVRTVGHLVAANIPPEAIACRYGGDEFVVAIPDCSEARAGAIAQELCRAVNASAPELAGRAFPAATLSVSVGAASRSFQDANGAPARSESAQEGETLFHLADSALYAAKSNGRNRVWRASEGGLDAPASARERDSA